MYIYIPESGPRCRVAVYGVPFTSTLRSEELVWRATPVSRATRLPPLIREYSFPGRRLLGLSFIPVGQYQLYQTSNDTKEGQNDI